ncbi:AI-2E family transporter [Streptosporangium sp. KLBMP 9127]|nr:AI-2E family transporter [Streptosporangium sp. KLBMP 9127]
MEEDPSARGEPRDRGVPDEPRPPSGARQAGAAELRAARAKNDQRTGGLRRAGEGAWWLLGIIALAGVILYVLVLIQTVVISVILAVFITAMLHPLDKRFRRHGMNRALSTTLAWGGGLLLFAGLVALLVPPTVAGLAELQSSFGKATTDLHTVAVSFGLDDQRLADLFNQASKYISERGSQIASGALAGAKTLGEILIGLIVAMVLSIYFLHSGDHLFRWLTDLFPAAARDRLQDAGSVTFDVIGRYVRGIALVGFVDGFFIGIALWILGVPIALPLAVLTFVGAFLPVVGAFLAGLLAAVVAFVAKGWLVALIVVAVTVLVQQIEGHVLAPQIYGRALELPGALILLAITIGSVLAGIIGAFLAAPVAAVLVALVKRSRPAPAET